MLTWDLLLWALARRNHRQECAKKITESELTIDAKVPVRMVGALEDVFMIILYHTSYVYFATQEKENIFLFSLVGLLYHCCAIRGTFI